MQSYTEILKAKYENQTANAASIIQIIIPTRSVGAEQITIYEPRVAIHGAIINLQSARKLMIDGLETTWNNNGEFNRVLLLDSESKIVRIEVEDHNESVTAKELLLKRNSTLPPLNTEQYPDPTNLKKVALVIGNDKYESKPLRNAGNDAISMRQTLQSLGFNVISVVDADSKTMQYKINEFITITNTADISLFFYSGHGFEINGMNFLVPIDNGKDVLTKSINVNEVLKNFKSYNDDDLNIVILDACRFSLFLSEINSETIELATINPPTGTLITYPTAPGSVSLDGTSSEGNGVYTAQLIKQMVVPQRVEDVFMNTRKAVYKEQIINNVPGKNGV